MKKVTYKTTRQIVEEYDITRQTINNWIKGGKLKAPKKDFRNWYTWTNIDEQNLINVINQKYALNNRVFQEIKEDPLLISNRRYLGSKQKLLDFINNVVETKTTNVNTFADLFAGTGVVAHFFKQKGMNVIVNDLLYSNVITYYTWFGNQEVDEKKIYDILNQLNLSNPSNDNYVSKNFGDKYFSLPNARKIGYIREKIDTYNLNNREKCILLTSLLYAMDKVANTVGHYDAYRKKMDSFQPIHLKMPLLENNQNNQIFCEDANELVKNIQADLVYIDTPYNSRQYGDAYHLLENIIRWEKPDVSGVARKMVNRNDIKSLYNLKSAPEVFDDLIQNIKAKYILVSYNNMAKKGNGRSNAKISNEEIIESLKKRGKVEVFETPFKVYTTGKTNIKNHKELLYLCTVEDKIKIKTKYVQSPINYSGGKFKLINQIIPKFPDKITTFYDVFAGGGNIGINVNANNVFINDIESNVINLFKYIYSTDVEEILSKIDEIILNYDLSNTKKYGYDFYNANSSDGLKQVNEKSYLKLRHDFNNGKYITNKNIIFYVLLIFSFNNQIRFNSAGKFNMPTGKRDFNIYMYNKLINFKKRINLLDINFTSCDFRKVIDSIIESNDPDSFVYLDPPYLISTASYNENGGWTEKDEQDLLVYLEKLNKKGIKFALSNVLVHKGNKNKMLIEWSKKYKTHFLEYNYNNSNYQSMAKNHKTVEVLITNY